MERIKSESDDKEHDESNKCNDENQEKMDTVTKRDDFISKFDMAETTTGKRLREGDEILESSVKKAKLERDDEEAGSNKYGKDNCEQNDISAKAEENHFLRLFTHILNVIIDVKGIQDEEIGKSITYIARSLNFSDKTTHFSDIDLAKFENIAAYLYRWGRLGAGLARFKILNAARNCKTLEEKLKKRNLNIICLGAGPGNDAIGFLSALSELYYPENLAITLVDKFKEWFFCTKLTDVFIKEDNFVKVSELCKKTKVELFYIDTDIERKQAPKNEDYLQDLSKADAIIICRMITNIKMRKVEFTGVSVFQFYLTFIN